MDFIYHQKDVDTRAASALSRYALETNRRCKLFSSFDEIPSDYDGLISGTVETIELALGPLVPKYFPDWTFPFIGRAVSYVNSKDLLKPPCFLKPSDRFKRFDGFVWDGVWSLLPAPPFEVQDVIHVISECRYYVTNGEVVVNGWYSPTLENEIESPELPAGLEIPSDWSGTIDVGMTSDNPSLIIECHPPCACGWYGESSDFMIFGKWLEDGWNFLKTA